ncbi:hypothetical protein [Nocardiopsis alba]|uniref:hypothetical protein n=1 Tax=Nocardiopsis alba TaxID=53437 RepID=UPI00037E3C91|nr:hypothetical protein [Nocardiopsis alba]
MENLSAQGLLVMRVCGALMFAGALTLLVAAGPLVGEPMWPQMAVGVMAFAMASWLSLLCHRETRRRSRVAFSEKGGAARR